MNKLAMGLACATAFLSACNAPDDDVAEDQVEDAAEASAAAAGTAEAALGLTEAQLLEADLLGPNNVELGDVTRIERAADGTVDRLLVEIEDSNPDRYVHVPIADLTPVTRGDDTDLSTTLTKEQLAAMPDVALPTA
jgi:hypothetical protein